MFDAISYLKKISSDNVYARENGFKVGETEGIEGLQPVMEQYRKTSNFILVDDAVDGSMVSNKVGWFNRRCYTIYILSSFREDDISDRNVKLSICREIFRQLLTRLIADTEEYGYNLVYMRTRDIRYREMNSYNLAGLTGVWFMLNVDEPTSLEYDPDEWAEE